MKMQTHLTTNENDDSNIDLFKIINILWFNKFIILFFTFATAALSFLYVNGTTPIYSADVLLQVEAKQASIPGFEELAGLTQETAIVGTEIALIKSRKNLGKAVDALKLEIVAHPNKIPILGNFYKRFFNKDSKTPPPKLWGLDKFTQKYSWGNERIKVESIHIPSYLLDQRLLLVAKKDNTFDVFTKDKKRLLTGKVGVQSISTNGKIKIFVSELKGIPGTEYIIKRRSKLAVLSSLKNKIKAKERGKKTGIIYMSMAGSNKKRMVEILDHISQTYIAQNKSRSSEEATNALAFLEEQVKPVKSLVDQAEGNLSKYRTDNQTADLSLETQAVLREVSDIDTKLQKLALQKDELRQRYTDNHPTIKAIISKERKLDNRKNRSLKKVSKLPKKQQKLLKLEGDFQVANTIYNDIINNIQEFKIAEASSVGNVYIIDSAIAGGTPIKPKKTLLLAVGTLLGMIFGISIVILRNIFHRTIDNPEKLEEMTGIPVYATVPLTEGVKTISRFKGGKKKQEPLLANLDMTDPAIESLRSLRTSLHFALLESKNNIVMITGPSPGIGKSFITSNFAAVIAASEQRVLLIDADMRKGYIHSLLNKDISPGLSDLISNKHTLEEVIHTVPVGDNNIDVITRGKAPPNPSELLMHHNFKELLTEVSSKYDLILIDTPPIHAVTDPTIIGKHAGVVFMVVRSDQHHIKEIEYAIKRVSHAGIQVKGFIFNGYVPKNKGYGYGYAYAYNSYYDDYKVTKE